MLRVGFQVYNAILRKHPLILREEERRGEALLRPAAFELRVGEGNPNLRHLALGKERADELYACTHEADIGHAALGGRLSTTPHTRTLDVDADIVLIGVALCKSYGVLATTTTQLQDYGVIVLEEIAMPMPLQRVVLAEYIIKFGLHKTLEGEVLGKLS